MKKIGKNKRVKFFMIYSLSIVLLLSLLYSRTCLACTSFAVYSDNIIYGMNFDYPDSEITIRIDEYEELNKVFYLSFEAFGLHSGDAFLNTEGLFTTMQDHVPYEPYTMYPEEGSETVSGLAMMSPYLFDTVDEAREYLHDREVIHAYGSYHSLYADAGGDAMILEVIDEEIARTDIKGSFIVMTNFPIALQAEKDYKDLTGFSIDRYVTAYEYIEEHFEEFNIEMAFEALEKTAQEGGTYPTQYSVVHDPVNQVSYIAIQRDYEKIWKVSLADNSVETYTGFNKQIAYTIGEEGVPFSQLVEYARSDEKAAEVQEENKIKDSNSTFIILPLILAVSVILLSLIVWVRFKKKS